MGRELKDVVVVDAVRTAFDMAGELNIKPKMRWIASAVAAVDPTIMGTAPVPATLKVLKKAGLSMTALAHA